MELVIHRARPLKWNRLQQATDRVLGPLPHQPEGRWVDHKADDAWQVVARDAHPTPGFRPTILMNGKEPTGLHLVSDEEARAAWARERPGIVSGPSPLWPSRVPFRRERWW